MSWAAPIVGLVALERLIELLYASHNTRRLLAEGAVESGAGHYPLIVALHAAWLLAVLLRAQPDTPPDWLWLGLYITLQAARVWVIRTLGPYWTTRIITLPGAPRVRRGPYRFLRHPNYAVVVGEIAVLPLVFGETGVALVFSLLNLALLAWRMRVENRALALRPLARRY